MFQIPRKQVWTSQPQGLVGIASDMPRPVSAWIPGLGDVARRAGQTVNVNNIGLVNADAVGPFGREYRHTDIERTRLDLESTWISTTDFSFLVLMRYGVALGSGQGAGVRPVGGSLSLRSTLYFGESGKVHFDFGGASAGSTRVSADVPTSLGTVACYVVTVGPAGMQLYRNNQLVGSNAATPTATRSAGLEFVIGDCYGGTGGNASYALVVAWNSQLPASVAKNLSGNPYLLFKRPDSRIFVPVSAGGGPASITGNVTATLDSITSNLQLVLNHIGTLSTSLQDIIVTSFGNLSHSTTLNVSLDSIDVNITGSVTAANVVNGTLGITLDGIVASFGGVITHTGSISIALDDIFVIVSGTVAGTPENITGDFALTLDGIVFTSSGNSGTITLTEDDINAIMNAIINNPKTLTVPKFLGLK